MSSYHYLYRITNLIDQKHYYGIRTSKNVSPTQDLGISYFSSSHDKEFITDQLIHPENYRYKVIIICNSIQKVINLEIKLHNKFNVGSNPKFYNKSIQTTSSFNTFGQVSVRDKNGNCFSVSVNDSKYLSGELQHISRGLVTVRDEYGVCFKVSKNDPRFLSGELNGVNKGRVSVKDKDGNTLSVIITDPRYLSGELIPVTKGKYKDMVQVKDECGNSFKVEKDDPRYLSGELISIMKGRVIVRDKDGKRFSVSINDPRYLSGELPSNTKGTKWIYNLELKRTKMIGINESLPDGWNLGRKIIWN